MQDVQPINGGVVGGRVLLKRLSQQQQPGNFNLQHHQPPLQPPQQALKCPRCDSLNTKFCYYNNYNLSQPRHFCKNCRRYWTKGGVLRNVPVGGGCRKSKRSSSSTKHKSSSSPPNKTCSNERSSTPPAVGGGGLFQIPEVDNFGMSSDLDPPVDSSPDNLFSGEIGGFMNLITHNSNNNSNNNSNENSSSGCFDDGNANVCAFATTSFTEFLHNQASHEWDMGKICGVHHEEEKIGGCTDLVDQTVRIEDFLHNRGLSTFDWHLTAENNQDFFDVPDNSTVDHQDYWNQSTTATHHHDPQWSDSTTSHFPLFLP